MEPGAIVIGLYIIVGLVFTLHALTNPKDY